MIPAAVLVRVRGADPQRRKVGHTSFFGLENGKSILTASGTLCLLRDSDGAANSASSAAVFVLCHADIIAPFLDSPTTQTSLVHDTTIDILVESTSSQSSVSSSDSSQWWSCSLHTLCDITSIDASLDVLTVSRHNRDWEIGWAKTIESPVMYRADGNASAVASRQSATELVQSYPPAPSSLSASFQYTNGRQRSAGLFAVLRVIRPTAELEAEQATLRQQRRERTNSSAASIPTSSSTSVTSWPLGYPSQIRPSNFPAFQVHPWSTAAAALARGTDVSVISSPYGLLSTKIFRNTLTKGIVSNMVYLSSEGVERDGNKSHFDQERSTSTAPSLLLLDARCFSGSEGAPVLIDSPSIPASTSISTAAFSPTLLALVTLPIRHTQRGSAVELNLAVPMHSVRSALAKKSLTVWTPPTQSNQTQQQQKGKGEAWKLVQALRSQSAIQPTPSFLAHPTAAASTSFPISVPHAVPSTTSASSSLAHAQNSVLMARLGGSWASCVTLTPDGYLLTNAHLLRPFLESEPSTSLEDPAGGPPPPRQLLHGDAIKLRSHITLTVRVDASNLQLASTSYISTWHSARIIYISLGSYDVALLKITCNSPLYAIPFVTTIPPIGATVYAIGHALFSPSSNLKPTVTKGVLGKVVKLKQDDNDSATESPALLVSSAAVHNGNSGGLLFAAPHNGHSGGLLGLVTSNVMHTPISPHMPLLAVHHHAGEISQEQLVKDRREHEDQMKSEHDRQISMLTQMILPHLNFSIPFNALLPLQQFCIGGARDLDLLRRVEATPLQVQRLWQLIDLNPAPSIQPNFPPRYTEVIRSLEEQHSK